MRLVPATEASTDSPRKSSRFSKKTWTCEASSLNSEWRHQVNGAKSRRTNEWMHTVLLFYKKNHILYIVHNSFELFLIRARARQLGKWVLLFDHVYILGSWWYKRFTTYDRWANVCLMLGVNNQSRKSNSDGALPSIALDWNQKNIFLLCHCINQDFSKQAMPLLLLLHVDPYWWC